tara:strand:- start:73 stop:312 length:240 start_codon:yes stop_codon:yes gene_type:complete
MSGARTYFKVLPSDVNPEYSVYLPDQDIEEGVSMDLMQPRAYNKFIDALYDMLSFPDVFEYEHLDNGINILYGEIKGIA